MAADFVFLNSLTKVIDGKFDESDVITSISALRNEVISFQIAVKSDCQSTGYRFDIGGLSKKEVKLFREQYVHCNYLDASSPDRKADDYFIHKHNGSFPDILLPLDSTGMFIGKDIYYIYFCQIRLKPSKKTRRNVSFKLISPWNDLLATKKLTLNIVDEDLPSHDLLVTHWFHNDCLAQYYGVKIFSKQYFSIFKNFVKGYVDHGNNTLLIPLFTPCLDTEVGKERFTTQLVDVYASSDGKWSFSFDRLKQYLDIAASCGIEYFEFAHLFTQWGAACCPKIIVIRDGKKSTEFGWNISSESEEYRSFLSAFLPLLDEFLTVNGYKERSVFHISDEPSQNTVEIYRRHSSFLRQYLKGYRFLDALSDIAFVNDVDLPAVADDHARPFIDGGYKTMVYYCCCQVFDNVPNGFINMPSLRNRIIGLLMYLNDSKGFLQWGYNFYNSFLSKERINPFIVNDAKGSFNPGDAFIVYPGFDGQPIDSLRNEVFRDAIQDYRLCLAAEKHSGKEAVISLLKKYGLDGYTDYPHKNADFLSLREEIQKLVA